MVEPVVSPPYPELATLCDTLYRHGAIYSAMSGSGTALYGIFTNNPLLDATAPLATHFADLPVWVERFSLPATTGI